MKLLGNVGLHLARTIVGTEGLRHERACPRLRRCYPTNVRTVDRNTRVLQKTLERHVIFSNCVGSSWLLDEMCSVHVRKVHYLPTNHHLGSRRGHPSSTEFNNSSITLVQERRALLHFYLDTWPVKFGPSSLPRLHMSSSSPTSTLG